MLSRHTPLKIEGSFAGMATGRPLEFDLLEAAFVHPHLERHADIFGSVVAEKPHRVGLDLAAAAEA